MILEYNEIGMIRCLSNSDYFLYKIIEFVCFVDKN